MTGETPGHREGAVECSAEAPQRWRTLVCIPALRLLLSDGGQVI